MNKIIFIVLLIVTFIYFSVITYIVYPGFFTGDAAYQYSEYLYNNYGDWQPPIMNIWWITFHNAGAVLLFQIIAYFLGIIIFGYCLIKGNHLIKFFIFIFIALFPPFSLTIFNILKDNNLFALMVLSSSFLYLHKLKKINNIQFSLLFPIIFYIIGVRFNAVFAVIPILFYIFRVCYNKNKIISVFLLVLTIFIITVANYVIIYKLFKAHKTYPQVIAMKYDLSAIECYTNHAYKIPNEVFAEPQKDVENREKLCTLLSTKSSDSIFWWSPQYTSPPFIGGVNSEKQYKLIKYEWTHTIFRYFFIYLSFRSKVFYNSLVNNTWYLGGAANNLYGINIKINKYEYFNILYKILMYCVIPISYYFGLLVLIIDIIILLFSFKFRLDSLGLCILISALFYEFMWFFLLPVADYRYFIWFYMGSIMSWLILFKPIK